MLIWGRFHKCRSSNTSELVSRERYRVSNGLCGNGLGRRAGGKNFTVIRAQWRPCTARWKITSRNHTTDLLCFLEVLNGLSALAKICDWAGVIPWAASWKFANHPEIITQFTWSRMSTI